MTADERIESRKKIRAEQAKIKKKAELGLYLNTNHVFSYANKGITDFIYTAVRGIGKTVIALETAIILKRKYGYENVKCYYFRLTDLSIKAMLANKAAKAIDPYLLDKYQLEISSKSNIVYDHGKELVEFMPLVSAASKGKGVNLYDCNWFPKDPAQKKRYIVTIWDEFVQDEIGKKAVGDPVAQYRIYREAIYRDSEMPGWYNGVYNFLMANNVSELAGITGALYNYIPNPTNHKRTFLTRKHAMFWNVPITESYKDKRKRSVNANITDYQNDPNYADVQRDLTLIKKKNIPLHKVTALLKFDKIDKKKWFCLYDSLYIRQYRGETVSKDIVIAMKRYLDDLYNVDVVKDILDRFDARGYMYADLMSMPLFTSQLMLIKKQ